MVFAVLYVATFLVTFGLIGGLLLTLGFNAVSMIIFLLFLSLVTFSVSDPSIMQGSDCPIVQRFDYWISDRHFYFADLTRWPMDFAPHSADQCFPVFYGFHH